MRDAAVQRVRVGGRQAQNEFKRLMASNLLFVGVAALAVGAALGMALPETGSGKRMGRGGAGHRDRAGARHGS
jgi:hypothetical protein